MEIIKCTDPNHPARRIHPNKNVRDTWFDGVLAEGSKHTGEYSLICQGCALANDIDGVFPPVKTVEERIKALEDIVKP